MKRIFIIIAVTLTSQVIFGQDYQSDFQQYFQDRDTINQLKTLKNWQKSNPKDAELFTSYFNYHFMKSQQEFLTITEEVPNGESLVLKDSLEQTAGFIGSKIYIDEDGLKKGLDKIDEGIELYPNRLDMRFGKIYALGQAEKWDEFTDEIIKTVEHSAINNNEWTWTNNEKYDSEAKEFLLSIQNYQLQLFNTENNDLLKNIREIAITILKHYPNHIENLTNIAITYIIAEEYEKAIDPLLKAEKINPKDVIVLINIARAYQGKGDKEKAIEYFEKIVEYDDEQMKEYAKKQLVKLKK